MTNIIFFLLIVFFLNGCDNYPKDSKGTLHNIKQHRIIKIGVIEHAPWTYREAGRASGIEAKVVTDFAQSMDVDLQWIYLSESQAVTHLKNYQLDLVIGGLTEANPRKDTVAFTRPYLEAGNNKSDRHVMAVSPGENHFIGILEKFLKTHEKQIRDYYHAEQDL